MQQRKTCVKQHNPDTNACVNTSSRNGKIVHFVAPDLCLYFITLASCVNITKCKWDQVRCDLSAVS